MHAISNSVILAILCSSGVCAISSKSPQKTTGRNTEIKELKNIFKGTRCGISASASNGGRIVGGDEAYPHAWPWQVAIRCSNFFGLKFLCGGSIISNEWIITSAHCAHPVIFNIRRDCKVFIGKHDLRRNESTELIAGISDFVVHTKYNAVDDQNSYDLALYKLTNSLKFTDAIKPICLPFGLPDLPYNKSCYATGWGITKYGSGSLSDRLMQLSMTVTEENNCHYPVGRIICTVRWDSNKDVCDGDSGGPLACQEHDRKWYLRGVLSTASEKCDFGAAFTKVSSFEKWIKNITSRV